MKDILPLSLVCEGCGKWTYDADWCQVFKHGTHHHDIYLCPSCYRNLEDTLELGRAFSLVAWEIIK
jgi:hypothetical protein